MPRKEGSDFMNENELETLTKRLRNKGYVVRLDSGLDGTWEAMVYKPVGIGGEAYETGPTMFEALKRAAEHLEKGPQ